MAIMAGGKEQGNRRARPDVDARGRRSVRAGRARWLRLPGTTGWAAAPNLFRKRIWHPAVEVGELGSATPHALRHTAVAHWIAALQGRVALLPTADLALSTMLVTEGIYRSAELGHEVTAQEVATESTSTAVDP